MDKHVQQLHAILQAARQSRFPLIVVIPGSGLIARHAIEGGAHFLMVLNAGLYRLSGVSSLASFLPFGNANDQTERLLRSQIVPRNNATPIVAGVMAEDPALPLHIRFHRLKELGVAGVINWPAVGLVSGTFREILTREGLTVEREICMLKDAKDQGFLTFGYAVTADDAALMAEAGTDALFLSLGWTRETQDIYEKSDRVQYAAVKLNEMVAAVKETGKDPVCIFYGGAVTLPEDTAELYRRTGVHGYGIGSALERIPIAKLITNTVRQLRSIPRSVDSASSGDGLGEMIGSSPFMMKLYHLIERVAPYDVNVCIEGESGTGKELIALQLHRLSHRNTQPFITLNCGAIPDTLIESEFFGHEKGAFTGAMNRRLGKFELADRGTLFLDEVAELSPKAQVSLLRVLQQKEISRVGGEKAIPVDVRIIAATHQNLKALVRRERFRADLYFRLNTLTLTAPPLRARVSDIPLLAKCFLRELALQFDKKVLGVAPDFLERLMRHTWPGNVREFKHVLCRTILLEDGPILAGDDFVPDTEHPYEPDQADQSFTVSESKANADYATILNALKVVGGNKTKAARLLGISRKTLYARLKKFPRHE